MNGKQKEMKHCSSQCDVKDFFLQKINIVSKQVNKKNYNKLKSNQIFISGKFVLIEEATKVLEFMHIHVCLLIC